MSQSKIVSGLPYKIVMESWNTHTSSSSQETFLWKAAARELKEKRERSQSVPLTLPASYSRFCFHIVSLLLSNPCTPSTLSKEAYAYFVCPTEIPQPPFAWKYYTSSKCCWSLGLIRKTIGSWQVTVKSSPLENPSRHWGNSTHGRDPSVAAPNGRRRQILGKGESWLLLNR